MADDGVQPRTDKDGLTGHNGGKAGRGYSRLVGHSSVETCALVVRHE